VNANVKDLLSEIANRIQFTYIPKGIKQ